MVIDFATAKRRLRSKDFGHLAREIESILCPGMVLPTPLVQLFEWIEANGFYEDAGGCRTGFLFPQDTLRARSTDNERPGGTLISFGAQDSADLKYWFCSENPEIRKRLCVFADTGSDGSRGALWLAEDGSQKIVHMGSGSGAGIVCVLAENPVDFLRLIAIGYDEICDGGRLDEPPNTDIAYVVHPNLAFRDWVERSFAVTIPKTGTDIVKHPVWMDATQSPDPFWQWTKRMVASPPAFKS